MNVQYRQNLLQMIIDLRNCFSTSKRNVFDNELGFDSVYRAQFFISFTNHSDVNTKLKLLIGAVSQLPSSAYSTLIVRNEKIYHVAIVLLEGELSALTPEGLPLVVSRLAVCH